MDTEEKITVYIENYGVNNLLKNYDKIELHYEAYEKLHNLELVLDTLNHKGINLESILGVVQVGNNMPYTNTFLKNICCEV